MSNPERDPQEQVCENGPGAAPAGQDAPLRAARFTDGLRSGAARADGAMGAVVEVLEPREVPLGGPRAMTVRRTLPQRARSLIGAWCFLDSYGPDDVSATGGMVVPRHPHTGLATVSWLFEGRIDHADSAGNWATVRPGEVNLMNAGAGITHTEYSTDDTTVLHGAQLWYALPDAHRFSEPALHRHRPDPVTGDGWTARVFLGGLLGVSSPVPTSIPLTGVELRLEPGASVRIGVPEDHEHGLLAVSGAVTLQGAHVPAAHLGYVGTGTGEITVTAGDGPVIALLLGGEPLGEQIIMWWNFVGRSHEEVVRWRAAYQQEMGFEPPGRGSPLASARARGLREDGEGALGSPVHGALLDALVGTAYDDGRAFPQFGDFAPDPQHPIPAPPLPHTRMRPRG